MGRGYIYEISDNLDLYPIRYMHTDDLLTHSHEFDYVQEMDCKNPYEASGIIDILKQYGIQCDVIKDEDNEDVLTFTITQEAKHNYFRPRLQQLENIVDNMTLPDFSKSIDSLQNLINDQYGDAVYFNNCFYTFDEFMRSAAPGSKFYIGNIYYMH